MSGGIAHARLYFHLRGSVESRLWSYSLASDTPFVGQGVPTPSFWFPGGPLAHRQALTGRSLTPAGVLKGCPLPLLACPASDCQLLPQSWRFLSCPHHLLARCSLFRVSLGLPLCCAFLLNCLLGGEVGGGQVLDCWLDDRDNQQSCRTAPGERAACCSTCHS